MCNNSSTLGRPESIYQRAIDDALVADAFSRDRGWGRPWSAVTTLVTPA